MRLVTVSDRTFRAAGSRLWNSLPSDVVDCQTVDTFRRRLKTFLIYFIVSWTIVCCLLCLYPVDLEVYT